MISNRSKRAFTLVELLAVMIIMSLMAGMIVAAVQGVNQTAKEARTRSIIAAIDNVLREQYESYKYRAYAIEIPDTFRPTSRTGNELGFEVLASEAGRARLMMLRDLQRMEMPDRLSDISSAPSLLRAAANPVLTAGTPGAPTDPPAGTVIDTRDNKGVRRMFNLSWYDSNASFAVGGDVVPSKMAAYRDRLPNSFNFTAAASVQNQGAECLYLIMTTSYVGGSPAIDAIPAANVADTDGDGLFEILDGWGQPLGFVRWPVGVFDLELSVDSSVPDDFDLFRSDYGYVIDRSVSTVALPTDVNVVSTATKPQAWSMRPLVFSAGVNKVFGVATNPWTAGNVEVPTFNYQAFSWRWPVGANFYGAELPGRGRGSGSNTYNEHPYPDPYLRRFIAANLSGGTFAGLLPGQTFSAADSADNITNYQLQATQR